MVHTTDLLRSYIRGVQRLSGIASVSFFVPASAGGVTNAILIHEGPLPAVPELEDLTAAEDFHRRSEPLSGDAEELSGKSYAYMAASSSPDCRLFRVPAVHTLLELAGRGQQATQPPTRHRRRRADMEAGARGSSPPAWIGLRFAEGADPFPEAPGPLTLPARPQEAAQTFGWWIWLLALGGTLAWHIRQVSAILSDPVTGLPGRTELQGRLLQEIENARRSRRPLAVLLLNPDEFASVNERLGRDAGDQVIQEVAARFRQSLRASDLVAKYGGAIFAAILPDADIPGGRTVAEKVLRNLTEAAYLGGAVRLGFSVGVAVFEPEDQSLAEPLDLIRRADQALNASKRAGGGRYAIWRPGSEAEEVGNLDRLSGIFTGNMAKDYRNMVLLSETVAVFASSADFEELASQAAGKLFATFKPDRVGLFHWPDSEGPRLVRGLSRGESMTVASQEQAEIRLQEGQRLLLERARQERNVFDTRFPGEEGRSEGVCYAIPLIAGDECLGCIYLEGLAGALCLDSSDLIFLRALASQLAVALDRARLSSQEKRRQEQERERLRAEVDELREALQEAKLEYRSEQMETVLATARRVAPTDATVLITGESGTGKELIARTIHQLSPRHKKPLIIVDCTAIPTSLIDSELFGHEKGAYTGAGQRKIGRLMEAHEGTVLLDEIGELPLEVQGKLLRFVQERQLTRVGATRSEAVDVRVIAATNRDLLTEVRNGRFREDLYYRLNVVRLVIPPLRERPDDILHLANHYLRTFAVLYHKGVERLTPEAEALLVRHGWPGNVRELQNRIQQAVILCETPEVTPAELGFSEESGIPVAQSITDRDFRSSEPLSAAGGAPAELEGESPSSPQLWDLLRAHLAREIEAVSAPGQIASPLGRWLGEDLILEAHAASGGVASRAAATLGLPETTYRRRWNRASAAKEAGLSPRSPTWPELRIVLARVVRYPDPDVEGLMEHCQQILLEEVLARHPDNVRLGAALLGVTAPTFRRRCAVLRSAGASSP